MFSGAELDVIKGGKEILKKCHYFYGEHYNGTEMYEGQTSYQEWFKYLPGQWRLIEDFGSEVLLENIEY